MNNQFRSIARLRELIAGLADQYRADRSDLQARVAAERRRRLGAESLLEDLLASRSWRVTAPLRRGANWVRGGDRTQAEGIHNATRGHGPTSLPSQRAAGGPEPTIDAALESIPRDILADSARTQLGAFLRSGASLSFARHERPRISVLLTLFNRAELTLSCLRSLLAEHDPSFEVVIVDNNSNDSTPELLSRIRGATVLRNTENLHFLRGINQAAKVARGEHLLILNNDTDLLPGALASALATLEGQPDIGAVGGKLILPDGRLQEAGSIIWNDGSCLGYARGADPLDPVSMFRREVDYCSGAFLLTPRATFESLGGFDLRYAPAYYEDTDYCLRLWKQGLRVIYEPSAVVLHHEFASSGSVRNATDLQRKHQLIFMEIHGSSLVKHSPPDPGAVLTARFASQRSRQKYLVIADAIPRPTRSTLDSQSLDCLSALVGNGYAVTILIMEARLEWPEVYRYLPAEVEVLSAASLGGLTAFMTERRKHYDAIQANPPHRDKLDLLIRKDPAGFAGIRIVDRIEEFTSGALKASKHRVGF